MAFVRLVITAKIAQLLCHAEKSAMGGIREKYPAARVDADNTVSLNFQHFDRLFQVHDTLGDER